MKGVWWFLAIGFGLAWTAWELAIRSGVTVSSLQFQLYALPGAFAPAIAAIVVRRWITREGFGDAGLAIDVTRWRYWVFAWLLPIGVLAVIVAEAMLFGIARPDFTLAHAAAGAAGAVGRVGAANLSGLRVVPPSLIGAILAVPLLWGEEFGWRGYLQTRLMPGRPVGAAIATGVIWAVWHYPLTLRGYDFPDHRVLGSLLFIVPTVLLSYIFGWIRERSGSIWAASLAHASTNIIGGRLSVMWFAGSSSLVTGYAGLLAIPPLFIVCLCIFRADEKNLRAGRATRGVPVERPAL